MVERGTGMIQREINASLHDTGMLIESGIDILDVRGPDGLDLLHRLCTNDLSTLEEGQVTPAVFTTDKGRIVDYIHVAKLPHSSLLFASGPSAEALIKWIEKYTVMEDVSIASASERMAVVTLLGAGTYNFVNSLSGRELPINQINAVEMDGIPVQVICLEEFNLQSALLVISSDKEAILRDHLQSKNVVSLSSRAYTKLRTLRGIPAAGHELTADFNPYEAGLLHAMSFRKGCYIGQEVIARLDTYGKVQKQMCQVLVDDLPDEVMPGNPVTYEGEEIGILTTVSDVSYDNSYSCIAILKKAPFVTDDSIRVFISGNIPGVARPFPIS